MVFIELRTGGNWAIQGIAAATADGKQVSKQMVKWIVGIKLESVVEIEAIVKKPLEPVKSTRVSNYELHIQKAYLVQTAPEQLALTFASASIRPGRIEDDDEEEVVEKTEGWLQCFTPRKDSNLRQDLQWQTQVPHQPHPSPCILTMLLCTNELLSALRFQKFDTE